MMTVNESPLTIGQQIHTRRKARNLTLSEVAKLAGVTQSHMSLLENDKRDPSLHVLNNVAKAVGAKVFILWKSV